MTLPILPTVVRLPAILSIIACLGLQPKAQALDNRDPFVIMRGGAGDQMDSRSYRGMMWEGSMAQWPSPEAYDRARYFDLTQHVPIPPAPPALGEPLPPALSPGFARSLAPDFAREIFYGGYVIAESLGKLTPKEASRVVAYRDTRRQLLTEIRAKLAELSGATPAARQAGLAELAARQDGRLQALADEAEALRDEFAWVQQVFRIKIVLPAGPFRLEQTEDGARMTVQKSGPAPGNIAELPLMFSAAYFYAGLSTEQRLLLEETGYGPVDDGGGFSFLPATARLTLPASLPPSLAEKISTFARQKESLKSELRDAIVHDDSFLNSTRTRRLAELATRQAPRWAALEALAEEIRVGLAAVGASGEVEDPGLPAELVQRIGQFNARKVEARRELLNRLRQLRSEHPDASYDIVRQGDGLAIAAADANARPAPGLAEFNANQARLYTAFAAESEVLRRDVQRYLDASPQRGTRTVDQLAGDFARAYAARENRDRYRDYSRAVLEPGLSAAQRRLLYQSALADPETSNGPSQP